jgi:hypothetical protein
VRGEVALAETDPPDIRVARYFNLRDADFPSTWIRKHIAVNEDPAAGRYQQWAFSPI